MAVWNTLVPKVVDRTLKRRSEKLADSIHDLIAKLKASETIATNADLTIYKEYINLAIQASTDELTKTERERVDRLARRNSLPEGWRSWLLFYRPESVVGAFIHVLFYISLAFGGVFIAAAFTGLFGRDYRLWLILLLVVIVSGAYSFQLRRVALRDKTFKCAVRLGVLANPNRDLNWIRRWSLAFQVGPVNPARDMFLRFLYYLFLVAAAQTLIGRDSRDWRDWKDWVVTLLISVFQFSLALFVRADLLRKRALRLLPSAE